MEPFLESGLSLDSSWSSGGLTAGSGCSTSAAGGDACLVSCVSSYIYIFLKVCMYEYD